jgi:hypothetical protein
MARTTPFPFAAFWDPAEHDAALNATVAQLIEWYESNLADSDKAADGYDAGAYGGAADAHFDALTLLTGVDLEIVKRYNDGEDVAPVSPANGPAPAPLVLTAHVPGAEFAAAHAHMSGERDRPGYTLMPASGWQIYDGPRLVRVTTWDERGGTVKTELVEHAQILQVLQGHLDDLANLTGPDDPYYELAAAAFGLVLSDAQTGTSIYAWPEMNRLVDRALTAAILRLDYPGHRITTAWEEF